MSHYLNYTVEEILDHDIVWVNKMQEIVAREELEKTLMELSIHGIDPKQIDSIRGKFESQFKNDQEIKADSKMELKKLQGISGFKIGKKNRTKFIR